MSGPIRNFCLARGQLTAAGTTTIYTTPSSNSAILKALNLNMRGTVGGQVVFAIQGRSGSPNVWVVNTNLSPNGVYTWGGELMANDGDSVVLYCGDQPLEYWLSGALLPYAAGQIAPA